MVVCISILKVDNTEMVHSQDAYHRAVWPNGFNNERSFGRTLIKKSKAAAIATIKENEEIEDEVDSEIDDLIMNSSWGCRWEPRKK